MLRQNVEAAFVTRAFYRGKAVDQLQMHLRGGMGFSADLSQSALSHENEGALLAHEGEETYGIVTVCFDHEGNELAPVGILPVYDTGCPRIFFLPLDLGVAPTTSYAVAAFFTFVGEYGIKNAMGGGRTGRPGV